MGRSWAKRGAVAGWLATSLPLCLACLALAVDGGRLFAVRAWAFSVADMAALAGVQELDLARLAEGEVYIVPDRARREAEALASRTLGENGWPPDRVRVTSVVVNVAAGSTAVHPKTGRWLKEPTVGVEVRLRVPLRFVPFPRETWVVARADASVLPRLDPCAAGCPR